MSTLRRDRILQFLENPQLPASLEFTHDERNSDYRFWFSLIMSAPIPDRDYKVFWEYLGEVGSQKRPGIRFIPDEWDPELTVSVFEMMEEDLIDTPFTIPKVIVERPTRGISCLGDIPALELIRK